MANKKTGVLYFIRQITMSFVLLTILMFFGLILLSLFAALISYTPFLFLILIIYVLNQDKKKQTNTNKGTRQLDTEKYIESLLRRGFREGIIKRKEYKQMRNNTMAEDTTELLKQSYVEGIIDDEQFDALLDIHLLLQENMDVSFKKSKNVSKSRN
jgi:uncharacterized membrane protein